MTPWTAAHKAPLPMRFSRQGYWSGLPFPSPGDLPNPGIEPRSPALQADSSPTELQGKQKGKRGDHRFKLTRLKVKSLSCVRFFAIPWTAAYHAPPSMGFSRQEYWSGVPLCTLFNFSITLTLLADKDITRKRNCKPIILTKY